MTIDLFGLRSLLFLPASNARAIDRIVPVKMPGAAYGRTWLRTTSHRVAPTPNAASRMAPGTARSASAEVMITIGSTRIAIVRPPDSRLRPPVKSASATTKIARPRSPYTIDGTPARLRTIVLINRVNRESCAYSSRYTAAPIPRGKLMSATNNIR